MILVIYQFKVVALAATFIKYQIVWLNHLRGKYNHGWKNTINISSIKSEI